MATTIVPVGTRGVFELKAPFFVNNQIIYECVSIKSLEDLRENSYDVIANIYTPVGLTKDDYSIDYQNDEYIITLKNINDNTFYQVPTSFIEKYPMYETIPYNILVVSANLGPVPFDFNTELAKEVVGNVLSDYIGVLPIVTVSLLKSGALSIDEANQLETTRKAAITNREIPYAKNKDLQKIIDEQKIHIKKLEGIIIANNL